MNADEGKTEETTGREVLVSGGATTGIPITLPNALCLSVRPSPVTTDTRPSCTFDGITTFMRESLHSM